MHFSKRFNLLPEVIYSLDAHEILNFKRPGISMAAHQVILQSSLHRARRLRVSLQPHNYKEERGEQHVAYELVGSPL